MDKIQKYEKWMPHELNEKNRERISAIFLQGYESKSFFHRIVIKSGFILRIINANYYGLHQINGKHRLQSHNRFG